MEPRWLVVLALSCVLLGAWLAHKLGRLREARRGRRAQLRGVRGERAAERLLVQRGYRVLARQQPAAYTLAVDGQPHLVELSIDFVVERRGRQYFVEVKAGELVSRAGFADTRRQLLEYQLATGARSLLLVDPERRQIREVRFPLAPVALEPRPSRAGVWLAAIVVLALGAAYWLRG